MTTISRIEEREKEWEARAAEGGHYTVPDNMISLAAMDRFGFNGGWSAAHKALREEWGVFGTALGEDGPSFHSYGTDGEAERYARGSVGLYPDGKVVRRIVSDWEDA